MEPRGTTAPVGVDAPGRGDRRFADPTWTDHPGYHRLMQAYLAVCEAVGEVVEGAEMADWRSRERARFVAGLLTSSLAPTNTLVGNPAAIKRAFETAGASLGRGARALLSDLRHNRGMPRQIRADAFEIGVDLAATPGAVVYRDEVLELLQYALATPGALTVLGSPVDLGRVTADTYITGGTTDHLTPWNGCYASARLLGGDATFALTNSGHIQTLVAPPGRSKSRYWTGPAPDLDPDVWRERAVEHEGTWWEHWAEWITPRSGPLRAAPSELGSRAHPPLEAAPGSYVHTAASP